MKIALIFVAWWIGLTLLFILGLSLLNPQTTGGLWRSHLGPDGSQYIEIAKNGYGSGTTTMSVLLTRFFPLFPLLVRLFSYITAGNYIAAALLVNAGCTLALAVYLWKIARIHGESEAAYRTVLYVLLFPSAVFLAAAYSEALFALTFVASVFYAMRRKWLAACVFGMLCALCRHVGIILLVVLGWEYMRQRDYSWRKVRADALLLLLVPAGTIAYLVYLLEAYGNAFLFKKAQWLAQQRQFSAFLYRPLVRAVRVIVNAPTFSPERWVTILNLLVFIAFVALTVYGAKRLPSTYTVLMVLYLLALLAVDSISYPLASMSRYVLPLFPGFLMLAVLGRRKAFNASYITISSALLGVFTITLAAGVVFFA